MDAVREYALKLLSRKEYSSYEITQKLSQKFPDHGEDIKKVLQEFSEKKWISDDRFAKAFVHDQVLSFRSGPEKILMKLRQKGISRDQGLIALSENFSEEDQMVMAQRLAAKKRDEFSRKDPLNEFEMSQKIIHFLIGKGYQLALAKKAVKSVFESDEL